MPADFSTIRNWYHRARDASAKWREEAEENFGFVSGNGQWSSEDLELLREQQRPAVVFNRLDIIVDGVSGSEVANRQEVHYLPVELGDVAVNELLTNAAEWVRDQSQAEDEESDAFRDMIITGMGWCTTRMEYEDNPEGMIVVERVDPLEMYWDPKSSKKNLQDARYVFRVREVDIADAKAMLPDADEGMLHAGWAEAPRPDSQVISYPRYEENAQPIDVKGLGRPRETVTLVECEYWEREAVWVVQNAGAVMIPQRVEVDQSQYRVLTKRLQQIGEPFEAMRRTQKVYYRAILGQDLVANNRVDPQKGGFRHKCMTGKRDRNDGTWYGIVRGGKDPQRWANKWLSQVLHIINSNAKGGLLAEIGAFRNPRKAEEQWADPSAITWLNDGAIRDGKVQEKPQAKWPEGLAQLMEYAIVSIRECTGVSQELLGQVAREQAGVLEYQRRQAGMTILSNMFDALRLYRKLQGKLMLELILRYLTDGRLIRISGKQGESYVPLVREEGVSEFDVKVDEAPSSPNQKERVWQMLQNFLPTLQTMQVPPEVWAEIIRYSPLPATMAESMAKAILEPPQPDPAMEAEVQKTQAEAERLKAQVQSEQAKAALDMAKAQEVGQSAGLEEQKAAFGMAAEQQKAALDQQRTAAELQADLARIEMELAALRERSAVQNAAMRDKFAIQSNAEHQKLAMQAALGAQKIRSTREMDEQRMRSTQALDEQKVRAAKAMVRAKPRQEQRR